MRRRRATPIDERELERRLDDLADGFAAPSRDELSAMARAATQSASVRSAWTRRRPLRLAGAVALVVVVAATLPAVEFRSDLHDLFTKEASAQPPVGVWRWDKLVPKSKTVADRAVHRSMRAHGAVPGRVARVTGVSAGGRRFSLLSAAGQRGQVCFGLKTPGPLRGFECVSFVDSRAIIHFTVSSRGSGAFWAVLVGAVRSDVARLVLTRADGKEEPLALNPWRAFNARADSRVGAFARLSAYSGDGTLVARASFGGPLWSPLCARSAKACPDSL